MHPATLGSQTRRMEQSREVTHTLGNAAQLPPSHRHRPSSHSWVRGAALTGGCCGKAKHGLGGLAFPAGAAGRARAPSSGSRALAEREGALLPEAAHGADQSMHAGSEPHPSQHHVCMCPVRRSHGTQHPESHGGRAALLPGQSGPKTRHLPLLAAAGLATGPRNLREGQPTPMAVCTPPRWVPIPPSPPRAPEAELYPPRFPTAPSLGWVGGTGLTSGWGSRAEGQRLAGQQHQQHRQCGSATSGTHGVPRGWSSSSGSGHGTDSASACFQARAAATTIFNKAERGRDP